MLNPYESPKQDNESEPAELKLAIGASNPLEFKAWRVIALFQLLGGLTFLGIWLWLKVFP